MKKKHNHNYFLIGAGEAARDLLIDIQNRYPHIEVVGILDDDPDKHGKKIKDVPILGAIKDLPKLVRSKKISSVVICIEKIAKVTLDSIVDSLVPGSCVLKIIPAEYESVKKNVTFDVLRNLSAEDLIGRSHIEIDATGIEKYLKGKKVFISGAGGTIGSAICRQLFKYPLKEIICFSRGEHSLYQLHEELSSITHQGKLKVSYVLGDIKDYEGLDEVMNTVKPDIVFHAAAHKHVPFMEDNAKEAVKNNIIGTDNMLKTSVRAGVSNFIFISTDKAVNPQNVMGYTKKFGERLTHYYNYRYGLLSSVVRFGNVIGSRGSVVPLFKRQLESGGPVTITHPDVERFFMSISDSANLVIHAASMAEQYRWIAGVGKGRIKPQMLNQQLKQRQSLGKQGERTFMLDMGKPVKIAEMVKRLIKVHGFRTPEDIEVIHTGLRKGEKIIEELYARNEDLKVTNNKKIFIIKNHPSSENKRAYDKLMRSLLKCKKHLSSASTKAVRLWLKNPLRHVIKPSQTTRTYKKELHD